jgi:hypothetical protein
MSFHCFPCNLTEKLTRVHLLLFETSGGKLPILKLLGSN